MVLARLCLHVRGARLAFTFAPSFRLYLGGGCWTAVRSWSTATVIAVFPELALLIMDLASASTWCVRQNSSRVVGVTPMA